MAELEHPMPSHPMAAPVLFCVSDPGPFGRIRIGKKIRIWIQIHDKKPKLEFKYNNLFNHSQPFFYQDPLKSNQRTSFRPH